MTITANAPGKGCKAYPHTIPAKYQSRSQYNTHLLQSQITFQLVITKADTVSELECQARALQCFAELSRWNTRPRPTHMPTVHVVSAKTRAGIAELQHAIATAALLDFNATGLTK